MKSNRLNFNKILERIEQANSERLMTKARTANRLAQKLRGVNRQMAYFVKSNALCSLVRKLPDYIRVSKDVKLRDFVVIELQGERSGLHLPFAMLNN